MKTPMHPRLAPALLALALIIVAPAFGAEPAAAEKEKKLTKNQEKFDADKDGKLNDEEKAAAKAAAAAKAKETRESNLAKYDADKDGKLGDEEKARKKADEDAAKEARKAEREAKKAQKETAQN
jgi:hypothetical protein